MKVRLDVCIVNYADLDLERRSTLPMKELAQEQMTAQAWVATLAPMYSKHIRIFKVTSLKFISV